MTIDIGNHQVSNLNLKGDIVIYGDDASRFGYDIAEPADVNKRWIPGSSYNEPWP